MGRHMIVTPILVIIGFTLLAPLLHALKVLPVRFLSAGLEMMLLQPLPHRHSHPSYYIQNVGPTLAVGLGGQPERSA